MAKDRLSSYVAHFAVAPKYLCTCFANPISEGISVSAASLHQQEDNLLHTQPKQQVTKETLSLPLTMIIESKAVLVIQECCRDANISAHRDQRRSGITAKRQNIFYESKAGEKRKRKAWHKMARLSPSKQHCARFVWILLPCCCHLTD